MTETKKKTPARKKATPKKATTKKHLRDQNGLLKGVEHQFDEDGFVNWRAMIPPEFVVVNEKRIKKKLPDWDEMSEEDKEKAKGLADEEDLLILLAGFKEVAKLRGYTSSRVVDVSTTADGGARVTHEIDWLPNFETDFLPVKTSAIANSILANSDGKFAAYHESIAHNRAFNRCVRNFLCIHILGNDEMPNVDIDAPKSAAGGGGDGLQGVVKALAGKMEKRGVTFKQLKEKLVKQDYTGAEDWDSMEDISDFDALNLMDSV